MVTRKKYELCSFHMDVFHDDFDDLYAFYQLESDIFLFKRISIYGGAGLAPGHPKRFWVPISYFLQKLKEF